MVNAGFNPLEEISRKTGKSIGELKEQMSKGAISSKMVQDAFISATAAGGKFYGMSQEGAKTLKGQISMLHESLDLMFNDLGQKGEGVVISSVQGLTKLIENYEQVGRVILGLVETYGAYRVGVALATFAENGHTIAMSLARAQILLTQKAQALLNATMLANPYVIAATALGVLIGSIIAANDGLTDAERAQKKFNDAVKEAEEAQAKYNQETEQAINLASSDGTATNERRKAMNLLIARYPSIIKKYIDEEGHLRNILGLKREIAAIDGNGKVLTYRGKAEDARRAADAYKLVSEAKKKAVAAGMSESQYTHFLTKEQQKQVKWADMWYEKNASPSWYKRGTTQERYNFAESFAKESGRKAARTKTENVVNVFQDAIGKWNKTRIATLRNALKKAAKKGGRTAVTLPYKELRGVALNHDDVNKLLTYTDGLFSAKSKKVVTKKDLDEQKKNLQAQLEGLSEIEAKGKKGAALKKKIANLSKREEAYSASNGKGISNKRTANKAKHDANKAKHDAEKAREENERLAKEAQDTINNNKAALLDDGKEKKIEEAKNKYITTIDAIDENIKKYKKNAKTLKESAADIENGLKPFVALKAQALEEYNKQLKLLAEQDIQSLYDYLDKYGTIQEKKYAINQEYADKIAKAQNEYDKKSLQKERDSKISSLNVQDIKQSIDWGGLFSQTGIILKEQLEPTIKKLIDITKSEDFKNEDYASQKVVYDLIDKMQELDESFDGGVYKKIADNINKYQDSLKKYSDAVDKEKDAINSVDNAKRRYAEATTDAEKEIISKEELEPAKAALKEASQAVTTFQSDVNQAAADINSAAAKAANQLRSIDSAISGLASGSLKEIGESMMQIDKLFNNGKLTEKIGEGIMKLLGGTNVGKKIADTLAKTLGKGGLVSQIISLVLSLLDVLAKEGIGGIIASLVSSILNAISGIIDNIFSGKFVQQIVSAVINGIGKLFSAIIGNLGHILSLGLLSRDMGDWFTNGNEKSVKKTTERLTKSNETLAKRIEGLSDTIGDSAGVKAVYAYKQALDAQNEINKNTMDVLKTQMGYHSAHKSNNHYADDAKIASYNNDAQLAFKAAGVDATQITGIDSIYSLSPEQLKAIRDFAPNLWKYLTEVGKYDKKEYWDAVVEQAGKTEKLTEQIRNNLTQTSFNTLRSNFLSTLMDMNADSADWSKKFQQDFFKSMVNRNVLDDEFDKWLKDFQDRWSKAVDSENMTQEDYDKYSEEYNKKMAELRKKTNDLAALVGYDDTEPQKATINEERSLSEDTGSQIVGRLTAVQIGVESGNNKRDAMIAQMSLMNTKVDDIRMSNVQIRDIADETRTILADSYMELKEINENTGKTARFLSEIQGDIRELKKITKERL